MGRGFEQRRALYRRPYASSCKKSKVGFVCDNVVPVCLAVTNRGFILVLEGMANFSQAAIDGF